MYSAFHSQIKASLFEVAYYLHHFTSGFFLKQHKNKTFGKLIHHANDKTTFNQTYRKSVIRQLYKFAKMLTARN